MTLPQPVLDLINNPETPIGIICDAILDHCSAALESDMASVWIVQGCTAADSEADSYWQAAAFLDEAAADAFAAQLNEWCVANGFHGRMKYNWEERYRERLSAKCPLDPRFECDSQGTTYTVVAVPLKG